VSFLRPDISPDGKLLSASVGEPNGDQFLRVWDLGGLGAGTMNLVSEFRFGQSVPESFVFSKDGRYLYGSSYYTGVSNIFRYEVATGHVEAVSNTDADFFRPLPLGDGRLLVLVYTSSGFVPSGHRSRRREGCEPNSFPRYGTREEVPGRHQVAGRFASRSR